MSDLVFPPKIIVPSDTQLRRGLHVARSAIDGLGLFASQAYRRGQVIWSETLKGQQLRPEDGGPLRWANHSDVPNAILLLGGHDLRSTLCALHPIKVDEEITYNYKVFGHTGQKMVCNCRQPSCPGFFVLREEWGENH